MKTILLGGAGFIGTNLALGLSRDSSAELTVADTDSGYFDPDILALENVRTVVSPMESEADFDALLDGQDEVYYLVSTTVPTTSNKSVVQELSANVLTAARMLDVCVRCKVKKVIFISSGGTVYGRNPCCPLREDSPTDPICAYGVQKLTIEKLLHLYRHMHGLDYRVIRLANPYGPYQRPNGILGAVTSFTYGALKGSQLPLYGDGSVVRDFIYIDDAVRGILNIARGESEHRVINLGSGRGTSIRQVLDTIADVLGKPLDILSLPARSVDVPVNYLDISLYESLYGPLEPIGLAEGVAATAGFMRERGMV